jgi:hypothetical protein
MTAIDADADGTLSAEEIEAAPDALLTLDADENGQIDNTEAPSLGHPPHPENSGPPGGGGRPPGPPPPPGPGGRR